MKNFPYKKEEIEEELENERLLEELETHETLDEEEDDY